MIEGVALLRRANVRVLGGAVEALEHVHQVRLMVELYDRMQEELVLAKVRVIPHDRNPAKANL